jgi:large subunit ribosomal protein L17
MMPDAKVVGALFDTIAARFSDRHGGYTRIVKLGPRPGDNAPMVLLELVDRPEDTKERKGGSGEKKERAPRGEAGAARGKKKKEKAAAASA